MKNIIVPVDFTELSEDALIIAQSIASKLNAELTALHVMNIPGEALLNEEGALVEGNGLDIHLLNEKRVTQENKLKRWLKTFEWPTKSKVLMGNTVEKVLDYAENENMDLIIMGTHNLHGVKEHISSTMGEQVMLQASMPVITVKCNRPDYVIKEMVFAHDFHQKSTKLHAIKTLQQAFDARLHLLQIINNKEEQNVGENLMKSFVQEHGLSNVQFHFLEDKNVVDGIARFSAEQKIDLLALETKGRRGFSSLIYGCVSSDLTHHMMAPILTFKE
ncbi:universal stress protein [Xanthovirga aplysinae]|uniref:universal stress protein n=1 Tax=Xanthovirga aplysinae TaxID=2529853 RepID=UPI0012BBDE75|nr:universal stress protein [Xanthovirga aplysinae]MTI32953.1 universal stress protein [Xanthovirga aplysinae]